MPNTRPGIDIYKGGKCSGCRLSDNKTVEIDWEIREKALSDLLKRVKSIGAAFDCIIPVSGGKDSIWQVVKALEYGLRPLAITWRTPGRTDLGEHNLKSLIDLGVDHFDVTINPVVERKFMHKALQTVGSTAVPMHFSIYSIPLRLAVDMKIPLVIWGESPFMEYGGDLGNSKLHKLDHEWLKTHSILQGTQLEDWTDDDLRPEELELYRLPSQEKFSGLEINSIFLGFFMPWSPVTSLNEAVKHGFKRRVEGPRIGYWDYADIDCSHIAVHHWFKWLKFGFTRLFDNLSIEIREGRLTRCQALEILKQKGCQRPIEDIESVCEFLHIGLSDFRKIEEQFRNQSIWKKYQGYWHIPDFILEDWDWQNPFFGGV